MERKSVFKPSQEGHLKNKSPYLIQGERKYRSVHKVRKKKRQRTKEK